MDEDDETSKASVTSTSSQTKSRRRSYNAAFDNDSGPDDRVDRLESSKRRLSTGAARSNGKAKEEIRDHPTETHNKLREDAPSSDAESLFDDDESLQALHCVICLAPIGDRTVIQPCCHDAYCFACIMNWAEMSRKCPLCVANIELLIHHIRGERDFVRHYLPPLNVKSDSPPLGRSTQEIREGARRQLFNRPTHPRFKYADWRARNKPAAMPEVDAEDLALEKRKYVYRHSLFVKHIAANRYTRFRDHTAQQVSSTPELRQRLTKWLRRELQVFDGVDLEFLVGYCVNIASQLELRSDSATRLLSEFLGEDKAEHFWHETYSFLRSPYKDIRHYDTAVQYDRPSCKPSDNSDEKENVGVKSRRSCSASLLSSDEDEKPSRMPRRHKDSSVSRRRDARRDRSDERRSRAAGDSYIPSYSVLNGPRSREPRSRSTGHPDRQRPPRHSHRERHGQPHKDEELHDPRKGRPDAREEPGHLEEAARDSDLEDVISLGDSDIGTRPVASAIIDQTSEPSNVARVARVEERNGRAGLNIRGFAGTAAPRGSAEIDVIRDFAPDLLSRISNSATYPARSRSETRRNRTTEVQQGSSGATSQLQVKGRGLRKGLVSSAMHDVLMSRLEEERLRSKANGLASPSKEAKSTASEAGLRDKVLFVLKERRQANLKAVQAPEEVKAKTSPTMQESEPRVVSNGDNAGKKAARLALLQSRLAKEKAASPTVAQGGFERSRSDSATATPPQASQGTQSTQAQVTTQQIPPASSVDKMAELRRRLAAEKLARAQT